MLGGKLERGFCFMIGIYKILSPSGKIYIGQSKDVEKRFYQYKTLNCKNQKPLYNSFLKYGIEKHKFDIICECEIDELNEKERYYQEIYDVLNINGLNCSYVSTSNKKLIHSEQTKLKISISNKGKKRNQEFKDLISKKMKNISLDTRFKMSVSAKNKIVPKEVRTKQALGKVGKSQKRYSVLNTENGIFHYSILEASITYNINYGKLKAVLMGQNKNKTNLIYFNKRNNQ